MRAAWGEVVVTHGDTPVAVRHVRKGERARVSPRALLGLGAALLVVGAAGFLLDVRQDRVASASVVQAAREHGDVRPPGPGLAGPGVALALLGVVSLVVGGVRRADRSVDVFTIGEAHAASLQVATPGLPGPSFALVRAEAGPVLRFTAALRGELWAANTHTTLAATIAAGRTRQADGVHQVSLSPGSRARVQLGALDFWISAVEPETTKIARGRLDGPTWFYSASALVVLGGLLALAHLVPPGATLHAGEYDADRLYHVGYLLKQSAPPRGPGVAYVSGDSEVEGGGGGGVVGTGAARKAGGPGRATAQRTTRAPLLARGDDPARAARSAGVLAWMHSDAGLAAHGSGAYAVGDGDGDVWAGLTGTQVGARDDVGGLGLAGTGAGGALRGEGVIGLGNVGLIGKGGNGGTCSQCASRGNGAGFGGRGGRTANVRLAEVTAVGGLDDALIRRVVRAHLQELRHCYDRTLTRHPQARGRVVVEFVIGGAGKVQSAVVGESDLRDAELGACATQAVRRWSFPRPEGGGSVMVSYPFVFAPA